MIVLFRTVLALGYIYVVGMGAYICFFGLPEFDTRATAERRVDETILQARQTTCQIYATMDPSVLTPTEQAKQAACASAQ